MARISLQDVNPGTYGAMRKLQDYVDGAGIDYKVLELVKMRASQMNGCAYCLDRHSQDARAAGETEARLHVLVAWREAPFYTERERAALAWTEAVTCVADGHVPDDVYEEVRKHFSEQELADLTLAIVAINGWNRLCIAFRVPAGTYKRKG